MSTRRHVRRICKQCQKVPCRKVEHLYCSVACARAGRRKPRPLCLICGIKPVKVRGRYKTCGRSCGARLKLTRAGNTYQARLALAKRMHAARQRKAMARLVAYLRDQVVLLDLATTDVERAKVLGKIYQRGRHDGHSAAYWRYVTNVRKSA